MLWEFKRQFVVDASPPGYWDGKSDLECATFFFCSRLDIQVKEIELLQNKIKNLNKDLAAIKLTKTECDKTKSTLHSVLNLPRYKYLVAFFKGKLHA